MAASTSASATEVFKEDLFKDTVWIVTGGGTGIGLEIATQAALLGANVAICGRRQEPLEEAANAIKEKKNTARVFFKTCMSSNKCMSRETGLAPNSRFCLTDFDLVSGDTRNSDSVKEFVQAVIAEFKVIDVLVNNGAPERNVLQISSQILAFYVHSVTNRMIP
jgi:NAD(P)-dependent dehydrogenase (short-subunit alcohol dehydrogenase family)